MHKDTWKPVSAALMAFIYTTQLMSCEVSHEPTLASGPYLAARAEAVTLSPLSNNILPTEAVNGLAAGSSEGTGGVSSDGAAWYTLPLWVPPGRAGVQPSLALSYNSYGRDGLLGVGWSLKGLSAISRCPKTLNQDGEAREVEFTTGASGGRFCLDGERLVAVAGEYGLHQTEYRTERDRFARVVSLESDEAGPRFFKVYLKDGTILTYGDERDSPNATLDGMRGRVEITSNGPQLAYNQYVRFSWILARVEDRSGNSLEVLYDKPQPSFPLHGYEQYPLEIRYTGSRSSGLASHTRSVKFFYRERAASRAWVSGFGLRQARLLSRVEMHGPHPTHPALLRSYHMEYASPSITERPLLTQFQECDGAGVCLPPTRFEWTTGALQFSRTLLRTGIADNLRVGDVNGDGKEELLYHLYQSGSIHWGSEQGLRPREDFNYSMGAEYFTSPSSPHLIDLNNDGLGDYVSVIQSYHPDVLGRLEYSLRVYTSTGSGFTRATDSHEPKVTVLHAEVLPSYVADLTGDGLPELLRLIPAATLTQRGPGYRLNQLGGFQPYTPLESPGALYMPATDIHGSGKAAMLSMGTTSWGSTPQYYMRATTLDSRRAEHTVETALPANECSRGQVCRYQFMDVNGDGLLDAVTSSMNIRNGLGVALNSGNGFGPLNQWDLRVPAGVTLEPQCYRGQSVVDMDSDGRQELLLADYDAWACSLPPPREASPRTWLLRPRPAVGSFDLHDLGLRAWDKLYVLDANGDGLPDLAQSDPQGIASYLRTGGKPDLLTRAVDGLGVAHQFTYKPISDSTVYRPGTLWRYPQRAVKSGMWVVARHTVGDGTTVLQDTDYRYGDGRVDLRGAGWLGFAERIATDRLTGATLESYYLTSMKVGPFYPYAASPYMEVATTLVDGRRHEVFRTFTHGHQLNAAGTLYSRAWSEVRTTSREWRSADPEDVLTKSDTTSREEYDEYGNATSITTSVQWEPQGLSYARRMTTSTTLTYAHQPARWLVAQPQRVVRSVTDEGGTTVTQTVQYVYDEATGLVRSELVEPDSQDPALYRRTDYERNGQGLVTEVRVSDRSGASRTRRLQYDDLDATCVVRMEGALPGHVTQLGCHPGLGVQAERLTPDNVLTQTKVDGFGRLRHTSSPGLAASTSLSYSLSEGGGLRIRASTAGFKTVTLEHDRFGREVLRRVDRGSEPAVLVQTVYGRLGQVERVSLPHAEGQTPVWQQYTHDVLGRVTELRGPEGLLERYEYRLLETRGWDARGHETRTVLDGLGRTVERTAVSPEGRLIPTRYQYGPLGLPSAVVDAHGNRMSMSYDRLGRRLTLTDPDLGTQSTRYNAFGEVVEHRDGNGSTLAYRYDLAGRLLDLTATDGRTGQVGTNTFVWDTAPNGLGQLAETVSADGIRQSFAYDSRGRTARMAWQVDGRAYSVEQTYDAYGRPQHTLYPEVAGQPRFGVERLYDSLGELRAVMGVGESVGWAAERRNAFGQLTLESFAHGVTTENRYDRLGRLRFIDSRRGTERLQALAYEYEPGGRLSSRHDLLARTTEDFSRDHLGRLTAWTVFQDCRRKATEYRYDDIGNLLARLSAATGGEDVWLQYNSRGTRPHAVTQSSWGSYGYDPAGNQLTAPGRSVTYTPLNLPAQIVTPTGSTTYRYDSAHGRTVARQSNGDEVLRLGGLYEQRTQGGVRTHVFSVPGAGRTVAQVLWTEGIGGGVVSRRVLYLHDDRLGSTETVTEAGGTSLLVERHKYGPFGERLQPTDLLRPLASTWGPVRRGFTGHEPDEAVGLINMRGRLYDPRLGRFLTPDPVVPAAQVGQAYNRYSYVLNDPLTYTDPSGFTPTLVTYGPGAGGWIGLGLSFLVVGLGLWLTPGGPPGGSPRVGQGAPVPGAGNGLPGQNGLPGMVQTAVQTAGAAWQLQQGVEAARMDMVAGVASGAYETLQDPLYPFVMAAEAGYQGYQENGMLGAVNAFNPAYHAMTAGYQAMGAWERSDYYTAGYQGTVSATQAASTVLVATGGAGSVQAAGASVAGATSRLASSSYQRWVSSVTPTLSLAPDAAHALAVQRASALRASLQRKQWPRATSIAVDRRSGAVFYGDSARRSASVHPQLQSRMDFPSREPWAIDNCAEFQAVNSSLQAGSQLDDLIVHTVTVRDGIPFPRCENCVRTTQGVFTTSD